jgi:hypothetical protein
VIHYNCIGTIEIPDALKLPETDIRVQTRKGVAINYASPLPTASGLEDGRAPL